VEDEPKTNIYSNPALSQEGRRVQKLTLISIGTLLAIFSIITGSFIFWLRSKPTTTPQVQPTSPPHTQEAQRYVAFLVYDPKEEKVINYGSGKIPILSNVHTHDLGIPTKPTSNPKLFTYKVKVVNQEGVVLKDLWYQAVKEFVQNKENQIVLHLTFDFVPGATVNVYNEKETLVWSGKMK
jgi:hypothetical protein